jgi:hypothetical protein
VESKNEAIESYNGNPLLVIESKTTPVESQWVTAAKMDL